MTDSDDCQAVEIARLREEMLTVAAGLDLVISGGCDQASNLARLRDHLRREVGDGYPS